MARRLAALLVVAGVVAAAPAADARPSPAALFRALGARATWSSGLPAHFSVARLVTYPSTDPSFVGQDYLYLAGPLAGQGLGFIVTDSSDVASTDMLGIIRDRAAKRRADEPPGSFWWTEVDQGATSACDSPAITCHETNLVIRIRNVIIVATIGSARRGSALAARDLRALLVAGTARLHALGG